MSDFIYDNFAETFKHPKRKCIAISQNEISYGQFHSAVYTTMEFLDALLTTGSNHSGQQKIVIISRNSTEYLVLIYACYFLGITWIPLNYQFPTKTINEILDSVNPDAIFCSKEFIFSVRENSKTKNLVEINSDYNQNFLVDVNLDLFSAKVNKKEGGGIAYIIFTSGSSGAPKGVVISYSALLNYLQASIKDLDFSENTKNLSITPYYFDAPLGTIFLTLIMGGELYLLPGITHPEVVASVLVENQITYIGTSPGLLKTLIDPIRSIKDKCSLKVVGIGGDDLIKKDVEILLEILPQLKVFNRYGPTETTCVASSYLVEKNLLAKLDKIPIGKPLHNVKFELWDVDRGFISGAGQGEIYISGIQNMEGYWNDPVLTEKNIYIDANGVQFYKTGDIANRDAEGVYTYISRSGRLVKKNGNRIYLSEIEFALNSISYIDAAICFETKSGNNSISSYIVPNITSLTRKQINSSLRELVPEFMLPDLYYCGEEVLLTSVGKFDVKIVEEGVRNGKFRVLD